MEIIRTILLFSSLFFIGTPATNADIMYLNNHVGNAKIENSHFTLLTHITALKLIQLLEDDESEVIADIYADPPTVMGSKNVNYVL